MIDNFKISFRGEEFNVVLNDTYGLLEVDDKRLELVRNLNSLSEHYDFDLFKNTMYIIRDVINTLTGDDFDRVYRVCDKNFSVLNDFFELMVSEVDRVAGDNSEYTDN